VAHGRLERLPRADRRGARVYVARGLRARVLGLAGLPEDALEPGEGLLLLRCRSVHTFGMRFALRIVFLDRRGRVVGVRERVPPRRLVCCRRAYAVLELRPGCRSAP
jgi:uncharacterized membrane protein (UPF0127 family)